MAPVFTTRERWKDRSPVFAYVGLLTLACVAPFEGQAAVVELVGMQITNVEIALGVSILLGSIWVAFHGIHSTLEVSLAKPVLLLLAVMLLSTVAAEGHRGEAIRFVGRFGGGFCICLLTASLLTIRRRFVGLAAATVTVGAIVAGLAVLEAFGSPLVSSWLDVFKPGPFYAGGLVRASSTLQYPTIASMYLEITFGFGLGLLVYCLTLSSRRMSVLASLSLLIIAAGIMATLTRGGLITLAVQLLLVITLYFQRRGIDRKLLVLLSLASIIGAVFLGFLYSSPTYRVRLQTQNPKGWYVAGFEVPGQLELLPGEVREVQIKVTNLGEVAWNPDGPHPFYVSYHWLDPTENRIVAFEGYRSALPDIVPPGADLTMKARVEAPMRVGRYRLAWDVVQEDRLWFGSETGISSYSMVLVQGAGELEPHPITEGPPLPVSESRYQLDRLALWRAVFLILVDRPLFGVGPGNFRLFYGKYLGLETWNRSLHANNTFLEFFADTGLPGGLLYLWLWFRLCTLLMQSWKRGISSDLPLLLAAVGAVSAIFVHGMVDDFFSFTPTYIMIWLSFGLAAALPGTEAGVQEPTGESSSE